MSVKLTWAFVKLIA